MLTTARGSSRLFFRKRPYYVVLYVLMAAFYPVRHVVVPYFLGKVTTLINKPASEGKDRALHRVARILVVLWSLALLFQIGRSVLDSFAMPLLQNHVRNTAISNILHTYRRNFKELQTGDINVKLYQLPESVTWRFKYMMNAAVPALLTLLVASYFFFRAHRSFGIVYTVFLSLFGILIYTMYVVLKRQWSETQREMQTLHEQIDDFLVNLFSMYVSGNVKYEKKRLEKYNKRTVDHWTRASLHRSVFRAFATFLKYAFLATMVAVAYVLRRSNAITDVAPIVFMAVTIESMLYDTTVNFVDMTFFEGDIDRMEQYLTELNKNDVQAPPHGRLERLVHQGAVEYSNASVGYPGADRPIVERVFLKATHRERIVITGHIGAGKSTLTKVLVGLHPYTGSIKLDGHEVRDMSSAELQRAITYIPQSPRLFDRTVYENIAYGLGKSCSPCKIENLLASLDIPRFPKLDAKAGRTGPPLGAHHHLPAAGVPEAHADCRSGRADRVVGPGNEGGGAEGDRVAVRGADGDDHHARHDGELEADAALDGGERGRGC